MRLSFAAIFLIAACGTAYAEEERAIVGLGTFSCAEFAKDYRDNPETADGFYRTWVQGFLSGQNAKALIEDTPRRNIPSPADIGKAIRHLCDNRPLAPVFLIANEFYKTLPLLVK